MKDLIDMNRENKQMHSAYLTSGLQLLTLLPF
jgi:hypothetical protein